jgi:hypothetical protein
MEANLRKCFIEMGQSFDEKLFLKASQTLSKDPLKFDFKILYVTWCFLFVLH